MPTSSILKFAVLMAALSSCNDTAQQNDAKSEAPVQQAPTTEKEKGTFGYDLAFIKKHDDPVVLLSGESKVIVSPKYQGKVFTSTAAGDAGLSFGWVNYKAFDGPPSTQMNAFGGENRLWLGPEGGKFSLFFKPGAKMDFPNWKTPSAYDTDAWDVDSKDSQQVSMHKDMELENYAGTRLSLRVDRKVKILDRKAAFAKLSVAPDDSLNVVGYATENKISNTGASAWTEKTGMPCIWMLDMFRPTPQTVILVPFANSKKEGFDKVATTNYFGEISADRLKHNDNLLFFRADGKSRGKLGIHPTKAKSFAGSYDAQNKVLTITNFDVDASARFLNQEWRTDRAAFSGDAVNAYNDGPLADGSQMGPFYELESVSPAAFLSKGQSLSHDHAVFHFTGSETALNNVSQKILGVSLDEIKKMFPDEQAK